MTALLRVGTKVRTTDRSARVHGRVPDKPEAIGIIRDHFRPYGRQSKDRTPPYYVTFETGEDAWYDASEVEHLRGSTKKKPAQLDREIAEVLAAQPSAVRNSHAQKKTSALKDIEPGLRNVARRSIDAENRFIAYAMEHGCLSRGQAATALTAFRKARVIKFDAVNGTFHVKHGRFLESDVLRRAAGAEE